MRKPTKRDYDRFDRKVMADIVEYGWSDIAVFPVPDEPGLPFNYSVGFTEKEHPELVIVGMDNEQGHGVLNAAYHQIRGGTRFNPNEYYSEVLEGLDVAFVEVSDLHDERFMMSMVTHLYGEDVTGLQLVWPDTHGRFPWHDDFEEQFKERQPLASSWKGPM